MTSWHARAQWPEKSPGRDGRSARCLAFAADAAEWPGIANAGKLRRRLQPAPRRASAHVEPLLTEDALCVQEPPDLGLLAFELLSGDDSPVAEVCQLWQLVRLLAGGLALACGRCGTRRPTAQPAALALVRPVIIPKGLMPGRGACDCSWASGACRDQL